MLDRYMIENSLLTEVRDAIELLSFELLQGRHPTIVARELIDICESIEEVQNLLEARNNHFEPQFTAKMLGRVKA